MTIETFAQKSASIIVSLQNALMYFIYEIDDHLPDDHPIKKSDAFINALDAVTMKLSIPAKKSPFKHSDPL